MVTIMRIIIKNYDDFFYDNTCGCIYLVQCKVKLDNVLNSTVYTFFHRMSLVLIENKMKNI